jgi:hypothetical protein
MKAGKREDEQPQPRETVGLENRSECDADVPKPFLSSCS